VFLDELGAQWSYEKEGFDLEGCWYLPDFWVEDWRVWIEVKGASPVLPDDAHDKCSRLCRASKTNVLLLSGEPWADERRNHYDITLFTNKIPDHDGTSGWGFGEGRRCADEIWLVSDEYGAFTLKAVAHERDGKDPLSGMYAGSVISALAAARGARFEHGVSGAH